jgi:hypothetical protein
MHSFLSPIRATCPARFILLYLVILVILGEEYTVAERSKAGTVFARSNTGIMG